MANPANAAGKSVLELGGVPMGHLRSVEGGDAYSDVVEEKVGVGHMAQKHLSGVKYEDITVTFGVGMSKALYEWIKPPSPGQRLARMERSRLPTPATML